MTETTNLHLTKDAPEEYYSVERVNANSDKIDAFAGDVATALQGKQDVLTFDTTPTAGSEKPVTSGGIYIAMNAKVETSTYTTDKAALDAEIATKSTVDDICGKGNRIYGTYASLNDIMTPGRYYVATGAQAVTITNSPYTAAGYGLYVIANSSDDRPAQILLPNPVQGDTDTYGLFFKRDYIYNAWGPWFKFEGTEVT